MDKDYGFKKVDDAGDTYICVADSDTRAVMGAKTSRAPHLQRRWDELMASNEGDHWPWGEPPEMVSKFLDKNLKQYMHSSIAEMAEVFVHSRGMGWPSAWLIEDNPLFVGQEVSTRAVDVLEEDSDPCDFSDERLYGVHDKWLKLFSELKKSAGSNGYKFDDIRWALPGTTRSGVTMCNKVRDGVRHLEKIKALGQPFSDMANNMLKGCKAYAPRATNAVLRGTRSAQSNWSVGDADDVERVRHGHYISITKPKGSYSTCNGIEHRTGHREYMDVAWKYHEPLIDVEIRCSVAAARDWHRHRAVMPWFLDVYVDDGKLVKFPTYDTSMLDENLWEETSDKFIELYEDGSLPEFAALHALPFLATVKLRCRASLPDLVYMLELRYGSKGANPEYKLQAKQGLYELAHQLGPRISNNEHILGILQGKEPTDFSYIGNKGYI